MSSSNLPDSRRTRKRQQTTDRLVEVAFDLFTTYGYAQVTMEQIAATADVAKGTLYNYFPVKESILAHRFHAELAESMRNAIAEYEALSGCVARLRAFLHRLASATERYREYMGPYLSYRLSQPGDTANTSGRNGVDLIYSKLISEGQATGEIRTDLPFEQLIATLRFMHLSTILRWLHTPETSLAAEFDAMLELFLNGARRTAV